MTPPADADDWRHVAPLELTPILTASLEAFYEHGFHGTTVRDIAGRVGVTVPALYYHHANKEAILVALLDIVTNDFFDRARRAADDAGDDPVTRLSYVVESIVLGITGRTTLSALETEIRYLSPENRERQSATRDRVEHLVLEIVVDGRDRGVFTVADPVETTRAVLGMCQWIPRWYRPDGSLAPAEVAQRYVAIALNTVGASR